MRPLIDRPDVRQLLDRAMAHDMITPSIAIVHGDAFALLPLLASVDHVLTDPPYGGQVFDRARSGGSDGRDISHAVDLGFPAAGSAFVAEASAQLRRLTRRWAAVFSDVESLHVWRQHLTTDGDGAPAMRYIRTAAWVKPGAPPQFTGDRPATGFEPITLAHGAAEKLRWNGGGSHGVWTEPIVRGTVRIHPTQKPERLMRTLIDLFTDAGELVLDPFVGSGTTLIAALKAGRQAIGIELDAAHYTHAAERLRLAATIEAVSRTS